MTLDALSDRLYDAFVAPDTKEATRIARHHLGEHLRDVVPVGSGYNVLIHLGDGGYRSAFASEAEDLPAVCQEAAAQLRAAGWTPTHARLEWRRNQLTLVVGSAPFPVATVVALHADAAVLIHPGMKPWEHRLNVAEALEVVAEWCAKNLPYHLPPFPGASDETHPCT